MTYRRAPFPPSLAAALLLLAALLAVVPFSGCRAGEEPVDFNTKIRPVLNAKCARCHGGVRRKGDFSLLFRAEALAPARSGLLPIVPGHPGDSELIRRITTSDPQERMPKDEEALSDEEIDNLRRWIEDGAPWDEHWAYLKPEPHPRPQVSDPSWPVNGIDAFVMARLDEEGLPPSPLADCRVLLRRVSLDLIGLPPTPEDADTFCADPSPEAYARVVDTLLASPHYGERWAAFWLDLARYADSQGYEKDNLRTIWKYRDWVIDSFNQDLPFDRFTLEQLAGDLLPNPTEAQQIATAFHRNTMTNDEGGTDDEEFRIAAVIDRVNTTWEIWQGTTFACVQCHSHPYDPFRHEEYYAFLAFFNNTADADHTNEWPTLATFDAPVADEGQTLLARIRQIEHEIDSLSALPALVFERRSWEKRLRDTIAVNGVPPLFEGRVLPHDILRIVATPENRRSPNLQTRIRRYYTSFAEAFDAQRTVLSTLNGALANLNPVRTPVMVALPAEEQRTTNVFERGNFLVKGAAVAPGVPGSLPPLPDGVPASRLGVARWMFSPDNPLTGRVLVNRFWEQLFGRGIVETLEDFGTQGSPPSHPKLLDWLALEFGQTHGWHLKALLREIVRSATYRQSSNVTPEHLAIDPGNVLLARGPRVRLSAEQLRDQALAVAGLLHPKMFGPSVMPPQPPGIWRSPYFGTDWKTSEGDERYRRAVYTFWRRTSPYPSMTTFDAPSREFCVSRRIRTNTPLQALVILNDPVYVEAARALARRMHADADDADALRAGYRLALLQDPDEAQFAILQQLYADAYHHYATHPEDAARLALLDSPEAPRLAALSVVANALLNLDAFLTKA